MYCGITNLPKTNTLILDLLFIVWESEGVHVWDSKWKVLEIHQSTIECLIAKFISKNIFQEKNGMWYKINIEI